MEQQNIVQAHKEQFEQEQEEFGTEIALHNFLVMVIDECLLKRMDVKGWEFNYYGDGYSDE